MSDGTSGYDLVVSKLEERSLIAPSWGDNVRARCPSHDDHRPSLSVACGDDGKPLVYCFAGCAFFDVIDALGLTLADVLGHEATAGERRLVAQYTYTDEEGSPLIRVSRWEPKGFTQERWNGRRWVSRVLNTRRTLYQLPSVIKAVASDTPVYILEGEKDVETFRSIATGATATTLLGGAGKWRSEYRSALEGADVFVVPDRDEAGRHGADVIVAALTGVARSVHTVWPLEGKDFTEHVLAGHGLEALAPFEPYDADWDEWTDDVPDVDWLVPDVIARGTLVWAYGSAETAKSMALMGIASELTHRGERVAYYGEEMDRRTEARRIARFRPNRERFLWKNGRGLDLSIPDHIDQIIAENRGTALIILDSYERVWGNVRANENRRAVEFARVCHEITLATGATVCVIDHTGFPFRDSDGNFHDQTEPRGASAKRQQADTAILFKRLGEYVPGKPFRFTMENKKPGRLGNPFTHRMQVVDTEGGGLAVVKEELSGQLVQVVQPVHDRGYPAEGDVEATPTHLEAETGLEATTEPAAGSSEPSPNDYAIEETVWTKQELLKIRRLCSGLAPMVPREAKWKVYAERMLSA